MRTKAKQPKVEPLCIRWMLRRDMPDVLDIDERAFDWEFQWEEETYIRHLRQRNEIGMVAERDGVIQGFIVYGLHKTRLELFRIAVHPHFQRQGVGRALMEKLCGKLSPNRRNLITICVPETQLNALLFFRAVGSLATGMRPDAFRDCEGIDMELGL